MTSPEFNPSSFDAVIATVKTEADADRRDRADFRAEMREDLQAIKALQRATNGRVRFIEKWLWAATGALAALTAPYAQKLAALLSQ